LGFTVAVVDAGKVKVYMKNFGEFYNNQIETASTIILSRTDAIAQKKLDDAVAQLREHNAVATIVTTPWSELTGAQLIDAMEGKASVAAELAQLEYEHHHHHEEGEHHCCDHHGEHGHHHHHEEGEHHCCDHHGEHGHHHHHEEGEHCCCGHHGEHEHHHHHHEEGEHCCCGHHEHHHHHAEEVFTAWGVETARKFTEAEINAALLSMDTGRYGIVLRAKGIIPCAEGGWIHFDYVPGEVNIRMGCAAVTGKICVIGAQLDEFGIAKLFGV